MSKFYLKLNNDGELYALEENKNTYHTIKGDDFANFIISLTSKKDLKVIADKQRNAIDLVCGKDVVIILNANDFLLKGKDSFLVKYLIDNGLEVKRLLKKSDTVYFGETKKTTKTKKTVKGLSITCTGIAVVIIVASFCKIGQSIVESNNKEKEPYGNIALVQKYDPTITQNPNNVFINIGEEEITYEVYYNYLMANYYDRIKKAAETYGIDPLFYLKIIAQNKAVALNSILPDGRFGLVGLEMEPLFKSGIAAYNFSANCYELIGIDKEKLADPEYQFNIGAMVLAQKIRLYDYNLLVALQSMGMKESDFALGLINYGKMIYGEDFEVNGSKYVFYYNAVLQNTQDIGWLNMFIDGNGHSFATDILNTYGDGSYITMMRHNDDGTNEKLEYRIYGNTFVLNKNEIVK